MKHENSYRYSLQFTRRFKRNERLGELLESYGPHKSELVLEALDEYTRAHPEVLEKAGIDKSIGREESGI